MAIVILILLYFIDYLVWEDLDKKLKQVKESRHKLKWLRYKKDKLILKFSTYKFLT